MENMPDEQITKAVSTPSIGLGTMLKKKNLEKPLLDCIATVQKGHP